jgi:hypothetical protein
MTKPLYHDVLIREMQLRKAVSMCIKVRKSYINRIENPCVPGSIPGRATKNTKASAFIQCWGFFYIYIKHHTKPLI